MLEPVQQMKSDGLDRKAVRAVYWDSVRGRPQRRVQKEKRLIDV